MESGTTVAIDSGFGAVANLARRFTVFGTNAVVEIVGDDRITIRRADAEPETIRLDGTDEDRHLAPMRRYAEVVRDAVESGDIPSHAPTFDDGAACDEVLDQLRASPFASRREDDDGDDGDDGDEIG